VTPCHDCLNKSPIEVCTVHKNLKFHQQSWSRCNKTRSDMLHQAQSRLKMNSLHKLPCTPSKQQRHRHHKPSQLSSPAPNTTPMQNHFGEHQAQTEPEKSSRNLCSKKSKKWLPQLIASSGGRSHSLGVKFHSRSPEVPIISRRGKDSALGHEP